MTSEIIKIEESELFDPENPEKLFHEINLFRIEGCYFNFSRHRKSSSKKPPSETYRYKIKTAEGEIDLKLNIDINPNYGKPGILAYKLLQTILKKYSDYGFPFPEGIPLGQREISTLIGRKSSSGRNKEQFEHALKQLRRTAIECDFYFKPKNKAGKWEKTDFEILNRYYLSGRENGKISQGYFILDPAIVQSLNNRYFFCLNYSRLQGLEPISSAIFKRLFFHFSNIHSGQNGKKFIFTKDYADVCKFWLGGLKPLKFISKIEKEQLGPHLKAVKSRRLIRSYKIEKNSKGDGFNLSFVPGEGFFDDYKRFYGNFPQLSLPFQAAADKRQYAQPMSLVSYFYQKLLKTEGVETEVLDQAEVDFASSLLKEFSYDDLRAWIDFSLDEAERTGFKIKKLGGIKNYKTEFFTRRKQRTQQETENKKIEAKQQKESLRFEYESFVRFQRAEYEKSAQIDQAQKAVLEKTKEKFFNVALEKLGKTAMAKMEARLNYNGFLDESAKIPSYEDWLKTHS